MIQWQLPHFISIHDGVKQEHQKIFKMCLAREKVEFQDALTKVVSPLTYYTI